MQIQNLYPLQLLLHNLNQSNEVFLLHSRKVATTTQVHGHQNPSHNSTSSYQYYKQVRKEFFLVCPDSITGGRYAIYLLGKVLLLPQSPK